MKAPRGLSSRIDWQRVIGEHPSHVPPAQSPPAPFEARHLSFTQTQELVKKAEAAGADGDLFRFAILRLTDLALADPPLRIPGPPGRGAASRQLTEGVKRMTPRREFAWLHWSNRPEESRPSRPLGRPSMTSTLSILSGLAWHLTKRTGKPHYSWLADLLAGIYPPIFLLKGSASPARKPWRQLSEAIRAYRTAHKTSGQEEHKALLHALETLSTPR